MKLLRRLGLLTGVVALPLLTGCSEGVFWKTGSFAPWVQAKWRAEEEYAQTLFVRRAKLEDWAERAGEMSPEERQRVSTEVARLAREDSVQLIRIEAVRTLAQFDTPEATTALRAALRDESIDVKIAACEAWGNRTGNESLAELRGVLEHEENIDVRIAATRALGNFEGQGAVEALSFALDDKDPALQHRAMASLEQASGRDYGRDVLAWREYVRGGDPQPSGESSIANALRDLF